MLDAEPVATLQLRMYNELMLATFPNNLTLQLMLKRSPNEHALAEFYLQMQKEISPRMADFHQLQQT